MSGQTSQMATVFLNKLHNESGQRPFRKPLYKALFLVEISCACLVPVTPADASSLVAQICLNLEERICLPTLSAGTQEYLPWTKIINGACLPHTENEHFPMIGIH